MDRPYLNLDDITTLQTKIEKCEKSHFKVKPGHAPLQVSRLYKERVGMGKDKGEVTRVAVNQDVRNQAEVKVLRDSQTDFLQIFAIRHDRSLKPLNIPFDLFKSFMDIFVVFPPFWNFVFRFGTKIEDNEFECPGFRARRSRLRNCDLGSIQESAYILRRAEFNGRGHIESRSSWSIRQTAVYHQLSSKPETCKSPMQNPAGHASRKSMILLIAPSSVLESQLAKSLHRARSNERAISPWNIQRLMVANSLSGWAGYMACLENELKNQSNRIGCATVGSDTEALSPLTDFNINFIDRQDLKTVEDTIIDLGVIIPSLLDTIVRIKDQCERSADSSSMSQDENSDLTAVLDEFDEYIQEARQLVERSKSLTESMRSTTQLLSDLLSYEEAVAMKGLTLESQRESRYMYHLTEKNTKDAAAVKILTVITLIYLPTSIVANFFSTQFVQNNDNGHLRVSTNVWLLAAIAIPLTILTVLLWWTWVRFTRISPANIPPPPALQVFQRQSSFRSFMYSRRKKSQKDLEGGLGLGSPQTPQTPGFDPSSLHDSAAGTWSTTATTLKSG